MKKGILTVILLLISINALFSFVHIFSYQDFEDFEDGQMLESMVIESNDDGTHGVNDVWGPGNIYTWPDVPGDTNMYLETIEPVKIVDIDGENCLYFNAKGTDKSILGLKSVPDTTEHTVKFYYDFYLDTKLNKDYEFVMFSSDDPGVIGRIWIVYKDDFLKIYRRESKDKVSELYSRQFNLGNKWNYFSVEIRFRKELRIILNNGAITQVEKLKRADFVDHYYIGNWIDKNKYSELSLYIKDFVVAHRK